MEVKMGMQKKRAKKEFYKLINYMKKHTRYVDLHLRLKCSVFGKNTNALQFVEKIKGFETEEAAWNSVYGVFIRMWG